ncbi:MAG: chromosome segregation protein SMC [Verrucomicrobiota bacterium]
MLLKSLEIHGFKSFADKTKLEFHEGVTGIVGPNGCGKSNIVDAMRWVLGETSAKALRGGEMADVIFNGTDRRTSLGMAEVTLTLSDCAGTLETEYDEVSLGRRVYRDGKGEYLINKQVCRLKDIQNLLVGTGIGRTSYSIMEQGKIDMLLSSKPEDRRAVFEEAAGITKYKTQKREALRKLDYTEANLVRIRDVIAENERQIRSLSRQASKAKRYQLLHNDVRTLDLHFSHKQWRELRAEKSELVGSTRSFRLRQDELEDEIESRQAQMATARVEYQQIEQRLSNLQGELARLENEVSSAQNRIDFNGERTHEQSLLIRQNEEEIEQTAEKLTAQERDIEQADIQLAEVSGRIEAQREEVSGLDSENAEIRSEHDRLTAELRNAEQCRTGLESRIASLAATVETNQSQLEADELRAQQLENEISRLREDESARREDSKRLKDRIDEHQRQIGRYDENLIELEQSYHKAKRSATEMQEALNQLHQLFSEKKSRLEVLRQFLADGEGFAKGTQAVIRELKQNASFSGEIESPLATYLQVADPYTAAIEAALDRQLQAVIVRDHSTAARIINSLRDDKLGEASLIASSSLQSAPSRSSHGKAPLGAEGWALDQVTCQGEVAPLVESLLSDCVIVADLETGLRLREEHPNLAIACRDGSFISAEGIVHGGASGDDRHSVLQMQAEITELHAVSESLNEELLTRQERRDALNARVDQLEDALTLAREKLQQKRVANSTQEGQLALVERDLNQLRNRAESLEWEQREVSDRREKVIAEVETLQTSSAEATDAVNVLLAQIDSDGAALASIRTREETLNRDITEARTQLAVEEGTARNLEEQREPMLSRRDELQSRREKCQADIQSYEERIERSAAETADLQHKIAIWTESSQKAREEQAGIQIEKNGYSERIEVGEETLTKLRREVQEVAEKRGKEEVRIAQFDLNLENLERSCRERYRTELEFFEPDSHQLLAVIEERRKARPTARKQPDSSAAESSSENEEAATDSDRDDSPELVDPAEPDWEFVEETVGALRTKLDSMGPVNVDAIEEFDELEEHYRFNQQQLEDLENSKEELLRMIARINRDTRKMFSETFEKIRKNFRDMFKELFGEKAKADLVLMDDADPLECGIDVIAKPPGKKLQSISLLSGGERSMTAVALLFGIYMVKPSPFCVLDELDAPLDEANITRFIRVLDRFIGDSQFVIVTHSKRTMSRADVMYGVSMEEFGVSKTVGVTFSKADEAVGMKRAGIGG